MRQAYEQKYALLEGRNTREIDVHKTRFFYYALYIFLRYKPCATNCCNGHRPLSLTVETQRLNTSWRLKSLHSPNSCKMLAAQTAPNSQPLQVRHHHQMAAATMAMAIEVMVAVVLLLRRWQLLSPQHERKQGQRHKQRRLLPRM